MLLLFLLVSRSHWRSYQGVFISTMSGFNVVTDWCVSHSLVLQKLGLRSAGIHCFHFSFLNVCFILTCQQQLIISGTFRTKEPCQQVQRHTTDCDILILCFIVTEHPEKILSAVWRYGRKRLPELPLTVMLLTSRWCCNTIYHFTLFFFHFSPSRQTSVALCRSIHLLALL